MSILTVSDLTALSEIASAPIGNLKIEYLSETGDHIKGEARSFVQDPSRPTFLTHNQDVRDAYLWVTAGGFEHFPSVRHLMKMVHEGGFVVHH